MKTLLLAGLFVFALALVPSGASAAALPGMLAAIGNTAPTQIEQVHARRYWHCHRRGVRRWCHRR